MSVSARDEEKASGYSKHPNGLDPKLNHIFRSAHVEKLSVDSSTMLQSAKHIQLKSFLQDFGLTFLASIIVVILTGTSFFVMTVQGEVAASLEFEGEKSSLLGEE